MFLVYLEGDDSYSGFSNNDELVAGAYTPTVEDLSTLADAVRPGILAQLGRP